MKLEEYLHASAVTNSISLEKFTKCLKELEFINKDISDLTEKDKQELIDILYTKEEIEFFLNNPQLAH